MPKILGRQRSKLRLKKIFLPLHQMLSNDTRRKIKDIVSGTFIKGPQDTCTTIRNFLCESFATSRTVKTEFESQSIIKEEQSRHLKKYAKEQGLWMDKLPASIQYLTRGGEARVFLNNDSRSVLKVNDAIYYATWLEFFNSLLLHNTFFENTLYTFLGFIEEENTLNVVLKQPFIITDSMVHLDDIKKFLEFNGFINTRRQDYIHREFGLILEDMHDENVLVKSETLFFIDSVFFTITPETSVSGF